MSARTAPPVGRYAPSPTGSLHLGNLRTAIAAWASARSRGGRFLLRVEDLDRPRVVDGAEERQLADLRQLGIDWDGEPVRQSLRSEVYRSHFDRLLRDGHVFPCFCSRRDIEQALSAPHVEDGAVGYPGTCRNLDEAETRRRIQAGERHCWRVRADRAVQPFADDFHHDSEPKRLGPGDDFVVLRADGLFAYQLACALDDALGGVTEVMRGEDLLDSGVRQVYLLELLGLPVPKYLHIPLMTGEDGRRLAKRRGSDDLAACLAHGADAAAVRSYLAWTLGQNEPGRRIEPEQLAAGFDPERIPRSAWTFRSGDLALFRS